MSRKTSPRIVIFGATGRLGKLLVHNFSEQGNAILSLGRTREALGGLPGDSRVHDLTKSHGGAPFIRAGDRVINAAHASHTSAILRLCPPDIERLIVIGSTRYLTRIPDAKADEVRDAAQVLQDSILPWVLLHPAMIYGAAGENNVQRMAALIRRFHIVPLPGGGKSLIQPIHINDVAEAVLRATDKPGLKRAVIHLGGPEAVPYYEFLRAIADASGTWVKVPSLPVSLLRLAAGMTAFVPGIPKITDAEVLRLMEDKDVDVKEMKDVLGVTPRPLKQGLKETFSK